MASQRTHERIVLAHHIIPTLYGHWPPNDIRGSGSLELHDDKFANLGPIHHGRKPPEQQPSRQELRAYHRQVEPLLNFPRFWLNDATRRVVAGAVGEVVRGERYTCYCCAICSNHLHVVIRRHRDAYEDMRSNLTQRIKQRLLESRLLGDACDDRHPIFAQRPYSVFLYTPEDIDRRIRYVSDNPQKEGLSPQSFDFEIAYDGWPFHKQRQKQAEARDAPRRQWR